MPPFTKQEAKKKKNFPFPEKEIYKWLEEI